MTRVENKAGMIMRGLVEPLYDTECIVHSLSNNNIRSVSVEFFTRPVGACMHETDTIKTERHTNLRVAGEVGKPYLYSIKGLRVEIMGGELDEIEKFSCSANLQFFVNDSLWSIYPLSLLNPIFISIGKSKIIEYNEGESVELQGALKKIADAHLKGEEISRSSLTSLFGLNYIKPGIDIRVPDPEGNKEGIEMGPHETIGCTIGSDPVKITEPFYMRVYITGTYWKPM